MPLLLLLFISINFLSNITQGLFIERNPNVKEKMITFNGHLFVFISGSEFLGLYNVKRLELEINFNFVL
jgi:hypothetical protein